MGPSFAGGREEGGRQPEMEGKRQSRPQRDILHQIVSRISVANQVCLGIWTVDICQEGRSLRSAPQRSHVANLRWCSHCTPRKPNGWDQGGDKVHRPPGTVHSPSTWSPELLGPGKSTKHRPNEVCAFVETLELNLSGLNLGSTLNPGPALDNSPAEQPGA